MSVTTAIKSWDGNAVHLAWRPSADPTRLLLPFTERAYNHPDPERVMREGLAFLAEFGGGPAEDEAALVRSARRFLDRNYPVALEADLIRRGVA